MSKANNFLILIQLASIILALLLTILPLPGWAVPYRPEWILLVLIFWNILPTTQGNLLIVWLTGLAVDLLTNSILGQHALTLTLICYLVMRLHRQFDSYPLQKQSLIIAVYSTLYLMINLWILALQGKNPGTWLYWGPVFTSMFMWPWIFVVLRELQRNLRNRY